MEYIPWAIYIECSISSNVYPDGFITGVKGIYEHAPFSVDICLVAECDPALGGRCFAERRPWVGAHAEAKNYTTRARERERAQPSRNRLGITLKFHAQRYCPKILQNSKNPRGVNLTAPDNRHSVARANSPGCLGNQFPRAYRTLTRIFASQHQVLFRDDRTVVEQRARHPMDAGPSFMTGSVDWHGYLLKIHSVVCSGAESGLAVCGKNSRRMNSMILLMRLFFSRSRITAAWYSIVSSNSISWSTQTPRASAAIRSRCNSSFLVGRPRRGFPVTGSTGRGGRNDNSDRSPFGGNRSGCSSRSASDGRPRNGRPVLGSIGIVVSFVWKFSIYLVDFCCSKQARYSVEMLDSPEPEDM